ncbi:MAG: transporter, partial [Actinomycetota bacterium]|nr:transporter [Actinomycetota bacterium]
PARLGAELAPPLAGLYVGSTVSARWQDRVVARGLGVRANATARLVEAGALIDRQGAPTVFIPADALIDARLEPALAGKVVGQGGLLVLRWQHGEQLLDTGIRADDKTGYPAWIRAIADRQPSEDEARSD